MAFKTPLKPPSEHSSGSLSGKPSKNLRKNLRKSLRKSLTVPGISQWSPARFFGGWGRNECVQSKGSSFVPEVVGSVVVSCDPFEEGARGERPVFAACF
jgi:hypothetical protein